MSTIGQDIQALRKKLSTKKDKARFTPFFQIKICLQDMSAALERVQEVLKDAVVIGHTVNTDLDSLRECPCRAIVDISENSMLKLLYWRTVNTEDPDTDEEIIRRPRVSLKKLSTTLLDRNIQQGKKGHSSVEDAQATMDLFKVVSKMVFELILREFLG